mmetsp:Transcript_35702/g.102948  ORF Transcript_35702/g.102948 Transcript_35702/m.102948 type:complete len:413 (+) Transcript_35702:3825-5063(+)
MTSGGSCVADADGAASFAACAVVSGAVDAAVVDGAVVASVLGGMVDGGPMGMPENSDGETSPLSSASSCLNTPAACTDVSGTGRAFAPLANSSGSNKPSPLKSEAMNKGCGGTCALTMKSSASSGLSSTSLKLSTLPKLVARKCLVPKLRSTAMMSAEISAFGTLITAWALKCPDSASRRAVMAAEPEPTSESVTLAGLRSRSRTDCSSMSAKYMMSLTNRSLMSALHLSVKSSGLIGKTSMSNCTISGVLPMRALKSFTDTGVVPSGKWPTSKGVKNSRDSTFPSSFRSKLSNIVSASSCEYGRSSVAAPRRNSRLERYSSPSWSKCSKDDFAEALTSGPKRALSSGMSNGLLYLFAVTAVVSVAAAVVSAGAAVVSADAAVVPCEAVVSGAAVVASVGDVVASASALATN